jgi:tetratricopeptide (TPR) repeat protein
LSSTYINFVMSTLWPQGKVQESLRALDAGLRNDPLSVDLQALLAYVRVSAGQYEQSVELGKRVLAADPGHLHAQQVVARALFQKGERADAIQRLEKLGQGSHHVLGYCYGITGRRAEAEALAVQHKDFPARLVLIYAGLGDADHVFEALERMHAEKHPLVGIYLTYPELGFLREDPRVSGVRRKLGLAE